MTFDTGHHWKTVGGTSMMRLLRRARRALNETYILDHLSKYPTHSVELFFFWSSSLSDSLTLIGDIISITPAMVGDLSFERWHHCLSVQRNIFMIWSQSLSILLKIRKHNIWFSHKWKSPNWSTKENWWLLATWFSKRTAQRPCHSPSARARSSKSPSRGPGTPHLGRGST